ncbi:sulfatase [Lacipirellula sp.]|uniref:sulfatase n=1 Tax=Lacipirellula sp. TaxID=2691419 RepID=UPI003D0B8D31
MTFQFRTYTTALLSGVFALLAVSASAQAAEAKKPNVIFILADDLGYSDVAAYGSKYHETPNIDKLAADGARFTNGYTCGPNCQPTRAALNSGQYGPRTGIYTVGGINRFDWSKRPLRPVDNVVQLPLDKVTLADSMKKAGYVTGMFGKWHLGKDAAHHPNKRGFDEAIVSQGKHFDFATDPQTDHPDDQYLADFLGDKAVDFIERHKDEPFYLYLPHYGVHAPYDAKEELVAKFKDKPAAGGHHDPRYAAMLYSVDESVGRIVAKLEELGLDDDTLVIFSSDNGGVGSYDTIGLDKKNGITDNSPLKGGKGTLYEGGFRVPYVFRWKGKIEPGRTEATPINSVDLYPTLVELAGGELPENYPLDGVSYAKLLTEEKPLERGKPLFWHFPGYLGASGDTWRTTPGGAIRDGEWKLIEYFEDGHLELYNVTEDIGEKNNLAASNPEKAKELHEKLKAWRQEINAPLPTANDPTKAQPVVKAGKNKGNKAGKANKNRGGKGKKRAAKQAASAE